MCDREREKDMSALRNRSERKITIIALFHLCYFATIIIEKENGDDIEAKRVNFKKENCICERLFFHLLVFLFF
jgi:hypothetical protein